MVHRETCLNVDQSEQARTQGPRSSILGAHQKDRDLAWTRECNQMMHFFSANQVQDQNHPRFY